MSKIVVGLPLTLKGNNSKQTDDVICFVNKLRVKVQLPIITIDERLSSTAAEKSLRNQGIKTGYNKEEVVLRAIQTIKEFFNIDKWQIGQPIVLADLAYQISLVEGVAAVVPPEEDNPNGHPVLITNKFKLGDGYSGNAYDIVSATRDGIVYPSLDPSIFELKFPNIDIEGRSVGSSSGGN